MSNEGNSQAGEKLSAIGQGQLLQHWDKLTSQQQQQLLSQIKGIDPSTFHLQQSLLKEKKIPSIASFGSFQDYSKRGSIEDKALGKQLISEGKVGCLIVAGGQGSRLRFEGPKGLFPVTSVKHKSLFQLFAEKIHAAGVQAGRSLAFAVMTSPVNHAETVRAFEQHNYFGLKKEQVTFFPQEMLPLLDFEGNLFLETTSSIAEGPDGNGTALKHFVNHGIWEKWNKLGIEYLNFVLIDNALADPFDAELIGFHKRRKADVVIKCVERRNAEEKVGVLLKQDNKACVVEYSEIPEDDFKSVLSDGTLKYPLANVSLFSFSMDFVEKIATKYDRQIPFHKAFKAVKYLDQNGTTRMADAPMAWKYEKFIFDVLPFANNVNALLGLREESFAPLKNAYGQDTLADVQAALQKFDRKTFSEISGVEAPLRAFELSPKFYYPTPDLFAKWKGKDLPEESYIEA